ncbi:MAG: hypothetical protein ACOYD9_05645 [Pyramidobacter sp.]|jgi:hypothetical protein
MKALNCLLFIVAVWALIWSGVRIKLKTPPLTAKTLWRSDGSLLLEFYGFDRMPSWAREVFRRVYSVGKDYTREGRRFRLTGMKISEENGERGLKMACTLAPIGSETHFTNNAAAGGER